MSALELELTMDQAAAVGKVLETCHGHPNAEVVFALFDLSRGRSVVVGGSTDNAIVLFMGGLGLLRRALRVASIETDLLRRAEIMEALQTALPYLEAAGVADAPAQTYGVRQ